MSSCAGGVVVIAGGVAALSVGAATAAVFGTSWMLYQGGSLVVHTVQGINRAVEEKEQKRLLQEKLRYDAALRNQQHIRNLQTSFLTEVREDLQSFSLKSGTAETVSGLQKLAAEAEALSFGNSDLTVQMEAANIAGLAALEKLAHKKEALLQKESSPVSTMGEHVLIEYISDMHVILSAIQPSENRAGLDVEALTPEQYKRTELWKEFLTVVSDVRMILMEEQQRANRYPISQKANKSLHRIFDGIDQRIQLLSAPSTGNAMLHDGIKRMKQCLQQYRILLQDLEEEEAEFMTLYPIYEKVQTELGQPVKKVMDFSGLEELRVALEDSKQSVARAERCAKLYRELGKDAYVCLAFDTEMRALGYSVVERQKILQSMDENLEKHTCANGMQIPVYDLPGQDAVTQVYKIDESCQIQVILHADGTTTMQTIMTGSNANATVAAQRKHCERLAELSQSVRKNWFILCDMIESEPPEKTSRSMIGTRENNGERNNHADGKKFERHQYL